MVKQSTPDDRGKMSAADIRIAAINDITMQPPENPCAVDGLLISRVDNGVLIVGGPKPVFLTGEFARSRLIPLLDQLDGQRDSADLSQATGLTIPELSSALALLHAKRLLQWGPTFTGSEAPETAAALSSRLANSRYFKNPAEAMAHATRNPVRIMGDDPAIDCSALSEQMSLLGINLADREEDLGPRSLTLILGATVPQEALESDTAGAVIHAYTLQGHLVVSSLLRDDLPCHSCFEYAIAEYRDSELYDSSGAQWSADSAYAGRLATSALAGNIASIVLRTAQIKLIRRALVVRLHDGEEFAVQVYSQPSCSTCGIGEAFSDDSVLMYEDQIAFPPADLLDPATHLAHYQPANVELQKPVTAWDSQQFSIGPGDVDDENVLRLLQTLHKTFGFKTDAGNGQYQRYAATGGNLGSPQCDVLVGKGAPGVPPGHYRYDGVNQRLVSFSESVLEIPDGAVQVVLSAGMSRMASKYGTSALRLVHLDAGVTRCHLIAAAIGEGLRPRLHLRSDSEELQRQINRPRMSDPVTCSITFDLVQGHDSDDAGRYPESVAGSRPSRRVQEGVGSELRTNSKGTLKTFLGFADSNADLAASRTIGSSFANLHEGITGRVSHRAWDDRPVSLDTVQQVAARIVTVLADVSSGLFGVTTDFSIVGQNIEGLSPRSWNIGPGGELDPLTTLEEKPLSHAVIEPEYVLAPVLAVATVRMADIARTGKPRAYLDALMDAGTGLYAGWLEMRRIGLEGGVFAGILPDKSVPKLLQGTLWDRRPVLALAMGHPLKDQPLDVPEVH